LVANGPGFIDLWLLCVPSAWDEVSIKTAMTRPTNLSVLNIKYNIIRKETIVWIKFNSLPGNLGGTPSCFTEGEKCLLQALD